MSGQTHSYVRSPSTSSGGAPASQTAQALALSPNTLERTAGCAVRVRTRAAHLSVMDLRGPDTDDHALAALLHREVAAALRDAGLLVEGETCVEWGVRVITEDRVWDDARRERSRETAEMEAGRLFSHLAPNGLYNGQRFVRAEVISRQRTRYSDHVTEWQPAKDGGDRV